MGLVDERDYELKLRRAQSGLQQLEADAGRWLDNHEKRVRVEPDPERDGWFDTFVSMSDKPPRDPFSLQLSECLHNMRSALDGLAYELAVSYTQPLPDEIANSSEFPIFGDVNGLGKGMYHRRQKNGDPATTSGLHKVRGIHPDAQIVIERLQPYNRGAAFREHPLWKLHALNRIDKHRLLHPLAVTSVGITSVTDDNINFAPGELVLMGGPVTENGTQVAHGPGPIPWDPSKKMNLNKFATLHIAFDTGGSDVKGKSVIVTLWETYYFIREFLPELVPFFN